MKINNVYDAYEAFLRKSDSNKTFKDIIEEAKSKVELNLTPAEIYAAKVLTNCDNDLDASDCYDLATYNNYAHSGMKCYASNVPGKLSKAYNNLALDITEYAGLLNIKKAYHLMYSYPIRKDTISCYLKDEKYDDSIIFTSAYITESDFTRDKYYCSAFGEAEEEGKVDIPYDDVIESIDTALKELGFININPYIDNHKYELVYVYPNTAGNKLINYLK